MEDDVGSPGNAIKTLIPTLPASMPTTETRDVASPAPDAAWATREVEMEVVKASSSNMVKSRAGMPRVEVGVAEGAMVVGMAVGEALVGATEGGVVIVVGVDDGEVVGDEVVGVPVDGDEVGAVVGSGGGVAEVGGAGVGVAKMEVVGVEVVGVTVAEWMEMRWELPSWDEQYLVSAWVWQLAMARVMLWGWCGGCVEDGDDVVGVGDEVVVGVGDEMGDGVGDATPVVGVAVADITRTLKFSYILL
ncbi:hypothetical protein CYMTET_28974 [Cymbomonas tetramitiformis]|uniref:Uncharacterized protein n=1 Tax=Cymbomonas tetramitiformis TaxID=36881 RepID=A0AAE0FMD8_9CHLO|nr:hypothetical protein CYMTET_28974 [Cymbomonas tetramitiformis]